MRKVNWGVIGTAGIAKGQTIPGMVLAENCYLYAIAGRKLEKAKEFQQLFGFEKAYGSYEEILADPKVEAVYIALPNTLHFEWVKKTLESGKHVLCEKPLVPTPQEAEELFRIASENGVYLMEAFAYLHSPWVAAIKNELEQGTVGKVRYIESQFVTSDYDMANIRMRRETNGGAMYDLGCYTASMITWLLGRQPDKIKAAADFSPEGIDLLTTAIFTYDDGIRAMMNCGMVLATEASRRLDQLRIEGTEGSIRSTGEFNGCGEMTYTVIKDGMEEVKTVSVPQNYCLETEQLGRCILDGEKPHVTAQFTIANLGTICRVLKEIGY
ncbi:MAG: Gfo/Idh/MocA family oxidoreductase [Lachnospiraceae bacterium]|nr:Gfo/Idh/MocA family oxidoreductase [Lachnospiraceae bacterium]